MHAFFHKINSDNFFSVLLFIPCNIHFIYERLKINLGQQRPHTTRDGVFRSGKLLPSSVVNRDRDRDAPSVGIIEPTRRSDDTPILVVIQERSDVALGHVTRLAHALVQLDL